MINSQEEHKTQGLKKVVFTEACIQSLTHGINNDAPFQKSVDDLIHGVQKTQEIISWQNNL